jgi:hypothetical protein
MIEPDYNPMGSCADGYDGILCTGCSVGFSRSGTFKCAICPEKGKNVMRLASILLLMIVYVVLIYIFLIP